MKYSVKIVSIKDNELSKILKVYDFVSNINYIYSNPVKKQELIKQALDQYKNKFNEYDNIAVEYIYPTAIAIEKEFKEIPESEDIKNLYEESLKEIKEYQATEEFAKESLINNMTSTISIIQAIREKAKELNMLDSQEFLNFLDELNK